MKLNSVGFVFLVTTITFWTNSGNIAGYPKKKNSPKRDVVPKSNIVERFDDITKSPNDGRLYRGLKLGNDLKVLLISDSSTNKAAVALAVGVGALNDFADLPGIANLLETVLLQRCKQFSYPNDFSEYLEAHGGREEIEKMTRADEQIFSFDIDPKYLVPALRRFWCYFREPLLGDGHKSNLEYAIRELDLYHENSSKFEINRIMEVEKLTAKKDHPFNHIYTGNRKTFSKYSLSLLRDKLRQFYDKWYSSNLMTLAVLGQEGLDELEAVVAPIFGRLENKNVERLIIRESNHPWAEEQYLKKRIYIVPQIEENILRLNFPVRSTVDQYKASPETYITHFLERRDSGSLVFLLRKEDLCFAFEAQFYVVAGLGNFTITCSLTVNGVKNTHDIIKLIFQYIFLLNDEGVQEWYFKEIKKLMEISFNHKEKEKPLSYVESLASNMKDIPCEDILTSSYILTEWKPSLIRLLLCYITVDNMNVTIVSNNFKEIANQTEEHYGTKYKIENISPDSIERLYAEEDLEKESSQTTPEWLLGMKNYEDKNIETKPKTPGWNNPDFMNLASELQLPSPNELIPENFEIYALDEDRSKHPDIIHESWLSQIWFKQDDKFNVSKLHVWININRPIWHSTPMIQSMMDIFGMLLRKAIGELVHSVTLAQNGGSILWSDNGLTIHLFGFPDKLPLLLEKIIQRITNKLEDYLTERSFGKMKAMRSSRKVKPIRSSIIPNKMNAISFDRQFSIFNTVQEFTTMLTGLNYDDMMRFVRTAFSRIFIKAFLFGNCNKLKAAEIVDVIEKSFKSSKLLPQEKQPPRRIELTPDRHFVQRMFHETPKLYYTYAIFPIGKKSLLINNIISILLFQVMKNLSANYSKECSDYAVEVPDCTIGEQGLDLVFIITSQSMGHFPQHIGNEIEHYLYHVKKKLLSLHESELEMYKQKVETKKSFNHADFRGLNEDYWDEILSGSPIFDQFEMEQRILSLVKRKDLITFFEGNFNYTSRKRRKLSIYMFPKYTKSSIIDSTESNDDIKITDSTSFKTSCYLSPSQN